MNHKTLAQKRTRKALARKNKQYTGPKYSKLEMMAHWAPLLSRAGIEMFADTGFTQKPQLKGYIDLPDMGPIRQVTYRMWYRDCWDMDKTFTKDFTYNGPRDQILVQVRYELGHYGGIKAELIEGDME